MKKFYKTVYTCQSGSALIISAIIFPLLILLLAMVLDLSRLYAVHNKAQNALDASLLGAVATQSTTDVTTETNRLFYANFPATYLGSNITSLNVVNDTQNCGKATATLTITVPATITGVFSSNFTNLTLTSQVSGGYCNSPNSLELAMVLDNTGSMGDSIDPSGTTKLDALKQASKTLMDILFGANVTTSNNIHVSVIPFDVNVNIGTTHSAWIQNTSAVNYTMDSPETYDPRTPPIGGLVANRFHDDPQDDTSYNGTNSYSDYTDDAPLSESTKFRVATAENKDTIFYTCTNSDATCWQNSNRGDTSLLQLQFALNDKGLLDSTFDSMQIAGSTRINVGLLWGWMTLSPKWQGLWDASKPNLPATQTGTLNKVAILMTDGENAIFAGINGTSDDNVTTLNICNAMKAEGITIYTIGFGTHDNPGGTIANVSDDGAVNETLLTNCASQPTYFFLSPSAADLQTAFKQIGDSIVYNTIHITQ